MAFAGVQGGHSVHSGLGDDDGGGASHAASATFGYTPTALWMDASQNMYIATLMRTHPQGGPHFIITTVAGRYQYSTDNNLGVVGVDGTSVRFNWPMGLSGDASGNRLSPTRSTMYFEHFLSNRQP
jgi:hypothetical protein